VFGLISSSVVARGTWFLFAEAGGTCEQQGLSSVSAFASKQWRMQASTCNLQAMQAMTGSTRARWSLLQQRPLRLSV